MPTGGAFDSLFGKKRPAPTPPALPPPKKPRTTVVVKCEATRGESGAGSATAPATVASLPPSFDERANVCWLSRLSDPYGGLVDSCHIMDEVILDKDDNEARYSYNNRILLHKTLHAAWDARLFVIHPDGTIGTALSDDQLVRMGITKTSRLPPSTLNPRRVAWLRKRPNGWVEFHLQSQTAKQRRRQANDVPSSDP